MVEIKKNVSIPLKSLSPKLLQRTSLDFYPNVGFPLYAQATAKCLFHPSRIKKTAAALWADEGRIPSEQICHKDETRVQVSDEPEQKGSIQSWMWGYLADEYSGSPRMVLFQYERTRAGYHPARFLGGQFHGYFTCDGYQVYHNLPERITVAGCLAHARRRFDEALTILKKDFTKERLKEITAYQAMARIRILYKIEEIIRVSHQKKGMKSVKSRQSRF